MIITVVYRDSLGIFRVEIRLREIIHGKNCETVLGSGPTICSAWEKAYDKILQLSYILRIRSNQFVTISKFIGV